MGTVEVPLPLAIHFQMRNKNTHTKGISHMLDFPGAQRRGHPMSGPNRQASLEDWRGLWEWEALDKQRRGRREFLPEGIVWEKAPVGMSRMLEGHFLELLEMFGLFSLELGRNCPKLRRCQTLALIHAVTFPIINYGKCMETGLLREQQQQKCLSKSKLEFTSLPSLSKAPPKQSYIIKR